MEDEVYYQTPNGYKVSYSEALEEYGNSQFEEFINQGQLVEIEQEENTMSAPISGSLYETPSGKVYTEGDLINEYGVEAFNSILAEGQLKKKDSTEQTSSFSDTQSPLNQTTQSQDLDNKIVPEKDYFTGVFGDVLRGIDSISQLGIGDFIDDMARSVDVGFQNGQISESGNDLLYGGAETSYEDIQEFISKTQAAGNLGPSDEMQDYTRIYEEEKAAGMSAWGVIKGLILNPSVIPEVMFSSFSAMANPDSLAAASTVVAGGAAVGAVAGVGVFSGPAALAGAAASLPYAFAAAGTLLETGLTFGELLQAKLEEKGLELNIENVQSVLNNESDLTELRLDAVARGVAIGAIDAFTGKLGGKVAKPFLEAAETAGTKVLSNKLKAKALGVATAVEAVGGSVGETAGIAATNVFGNTGQDYDVGEIMLEGIAEAPGSIKDLISIRNSKAKYKINNKIATEEQIDFIINNMSYDQLTNPKLKIKIENDYKGRKLKLHNKILDGRTKQSVLTARPDLNEATLDAIVKLEREVSIQEGKTLGTVTGKKYIADLKAQIIELQNNQLEESSVNESEKIIGSDVELTEQMKLDYDELSIEEQESYKREASNILNDTDTESLEVLEKAALLFNDKNVNIEKEKKINDQFNDLSIEEKNKYNEESKLILETETGETEFTEEQINERSKLLLNEELDFLESDLEGETRFSLAENNEGVVSADLNDIEKVTDEMNQMESSEVNFKTPTGDKVSEMNPLEESNSTVEFTDKDAQDNGFDSKEDMVKPIEDFNDMKMIFGISDIAAGGTIKDSKGNTMKVEGGIMFNALAKFKAAWAGVGREKSETQYKNAVKLYEENKPLFERLWKEKKLPNGHIPMAIVRMSNDAINSNEIVFRYLSPEVKAQPKENQVAALNSLTEKLKGNKPLLNFIKNKNITTLGGLLDAVVVDAKGRSKAKNKEAADAFLSLDERAALFKSITSPEKTQSNTTKDGSIKPPILKALYKGVSDANPSVFLAKNIYNAVGEPSMMKTKKGDVVSIVGIDVLNGGVVDIDHGNYGTGPAGRLIALIKNPTNGVNIFPEWKVKSNRVHKKNTSGKLPSDLGVLAQSMGTAANDKAFQGASVNTKMTDIQKLAAKFRFAFPGVTVVDTKAEFDAMLKQPGVRTKVTKGKVILGMTADGKVFLNPEQSSLATPIHEFAHIWIDFLGSKASGEKGTTLLKKGLKLVEGTDALKSAIEEYGDTPLAREEALVELMATKGETIVLAGKQSDFKEWMNAVFKYIKSKFITSERLFAKEEIKELADQLKSKKITQKKYDAGIKKIKSSFNRNIKSMTIDDFINTGLADLFKGKELSDSFDAKKESKSKKFKVESNDEKKERTKKINAIKDFIKESRAQGVNESAIKIKLKNRGVDVDIIKEAFVKTKNKSKVKFNITELNLEGYDRVMNSIVDGIIDKSKLRGTKYSNIPENVINYLQAQSKVYADATDVQREELYREVRSKFGLKEIAAPTAKKILGISDTSKKVTTTEKKIGIIGLTEQRKGATSAIRARVAIGKKLISELKDMISSGVISLKQSTTILNKFNSINIDKLSSIEGFIDYMSKVINDSEYADKLSKVKKQIPKAKKNVKTKIGIAEIININLQRVLSINPASIPESVFNSYIALVDMFSKSGLSLNPSEINDIKTISDNILKEMDNEISMIPILKDIFDSYKDKVIKEGKVSYLDTLNKMFEENVIVSEELTLMKKYKSEILEVESKTEKTKEELDEERKDTIDSILKKQKTNSSPLPSKDERKLAEEFEKLYKNKEVLNNLSINELKTIDKLIDNINNGYLPALVEVQVEIMESIIDAKLGSEGIKVSRLLPLSKMYAKLKSLITKRGVVLEMIRRNPLFYIDQVFGNFKNKDIFNSVYEKSTIALEKYEKGLKNIFGRIEKAELKVFKSFKRNGNATLMSKFKQMIYMIQLEYDSNIGNPEVNQASGFILETIEKIDSDETTFSFKDAIMLQEIYDKFKDNNTGEIDIDALYKTFNKAEIESINTIKSINLELSEKAVFTAGVIRGEVINSRVNYVHLNTLPKDKTDSSVTPSSVGDWNNSLKPSTKAKSLVKRSGGISPLNFDVYASVSKSAKGVLLDYHMTRPIRTARRTLNRIKSNLKGDKSRIDTDERVKFNAIKDSYEEVLKNLLDNSYTETSIGDNALQFLKKNGYRAILASTTRWVAELTSNTAFVAITNPIAFALGSGLGPKFLSSEEAISIMEMLDSKVVTRIYPNNDMSGKWVDPSIMNQNKGLKGGRAQNKIKNVANQVWNYTAARWQGGVATIADGLISTPDKIIMRPIWFGSFKQKFKEITGTNPDFKKIAAGDEKYMEKFKEALSVSSKKADENSVITGASSSPFMGILKGASNVNQKGYVKFFNTFNNFMTTFLIYEYITARTGVVNAIGRGHLSKTKGAQLLAGSATRMVMYTMISQVLAEALGGVAEDEPEETKSLDKKLGQAVASSMMSMIAGRDFGNATKLIINYGIEEFNKEYLGELREGEYDPYKDAIAYQVIPKVKEGETTTAGEIASSMTAGLGPAVKTIDFILAKMTEGPKKTTTAIEKREKELLYRLPLELLGHSGFVPMYKDVRKLVLKSIYNEMNSEKAQAKSEKEREEKILQGYDSRAQMKRYNPSLWEDTFGPNSINWESEEARRIIKKNLREENQNLRDLKNNFTPGSTSFGGNGFGGNKKSRNSFGGNGKSSNSFGSNKFGGNK